MTTCAFRIVQIYSDRQGASLASQASRNLQREFDHSECVETTWNTELLRSPKLRMLAAREAAEADLVILVAEEGTPVTPEIAGWLQLWQRRSRRTRSTLVALLRRRSLAAASCVEHLLHNFARRARMDFFCHSRLVTKSFRRSTEKSSFK
jgi:hypothetical protein